MTRTSATERTRQRGVVIVITLLAIVLLTALVLFVLNLGQQVERRIAAQNSADATAAAGANWVARSMNTVARNNIEMTRMIGLINVLDAMPRSTAYALHEQTAFHEALDNQLASGLTNTGPASLASLLDQLLTDYLQELEDEVEQLENANDFFLDNDTTQLTHYNAPSGHGQLWRALFAMDEVNQSTLAELGSYAQVGSTEAGRLTYPDNEAQAAAFMVPVQPEMPWSRGRFNDFERPVKYGLLPDGVDDEYTNRGPYDTVFGWHDTISETFGGTWVPGTRQTAQGGSGGVPIGSGAGGSNGRRVGGTTVVTGYHVWGMHRHLLHRVGDFTHDRLRNSRLSMWVRTMSDAKMAYLWPDDDATPDDDELAATIAPQWINQWSQAIDIARDEPDRIVETGFIAVEIKSKYPRGHAQFLTAGTWALVDDGGRWQPRLVRVRGWHDPRDWPAPQVAQHGWMDQWQYTVFFDQTINIAAQTDADGNMIPQPVYRIDHFYFAGVNVGEGETIMDPYEGFNPDSTDAPAPSDFDHIRVADEPTARRRYLTFLALAQRGDVPQTWPSAFHGGKPHPAMIGLAQAKVFNNHSWDLWTPMWHARLEPITQIEQWAQTMQRSRDDLARATTINDEHYNDLETYLTRSAGLAEVMLGH